MKLDIYLNYGGNCREAFTFYEHHLGGAITMMMTHGEQPAPNAVAPDWKDKVLHARVNLGGAVLMGADIPPDRFQPMRSAYVSLTLDTADEAERIYALLSDGGQIFMRMEETFFAVRFAMLRDRFGTSWDAFDRASSLVIRMVRRIRLDEPGTVPPRIEGMRT